MPGQEQSEYSQEKLVAKSKKELGEMCRSIGIPHSNRKKEALITTVNRSLRCR